MAAAAAVISRKFINPSSSSSSLLRSSASSHSSCPRLWRSASARSPRCYGFLYVEESAPIEPFREILEVLSRCLYVSLFILVGFGDEVDCLFDFVPLSNCEYMPCEYFSVEDTRMW